MGVEVDPVREASQWQAARDQTTQSPAQEAMLPVASVARRLGVAPSTLRTWDRRYGLGPTEHTGGRHRRYGVADIGRLELMQRALLRGASTAEAAHYALRRMPKSEPAGVEVPVAPPGLHAAETGSGAAALRIDTPDGELVVPAEERVDFAAGDEHGAARLARRLGARARSMDIAGVRVALEESISLLGVPRAWEEVHAPVLEALCGQQVDGGDSASHRDAAAMLRECVLASLVRANPVLATPRNPRPVLLVALGEGQVELSLYALAAALGAYGLVAQPFGSELPADILATAVRRAAPVAVVLWARGAECADATLFGRLSRARQPRRLFAGGPGWRAQLLPATVEQLPDVSVALERLSYIAG